ncbi:MAG: hypothetical protein ABIE43_04255 [Patescibacteria group bacterium]
MDIISHGLWTNLVFKELPAEQKSLVIVFGILPDVLSFSSVTLRHFFKRTMHFARPSLAVFPPYVFKIYNVTHSLVIWLGAYMFFKLFGLNYWTLALYAWGLHILFDIFTHTKSFFPTPIFWPFSKFNFSGINWGNKWFMIFNYSVLLFMYLVFYF